MVIICLGKNYFLATPLSLTLEFLSCYKAFNSIKGALYSCHMGYHVQPTC